MPIDADYLRQHYASLSDEELRSLDRDDLTETAQKLLDWEFKRRGLESGELNSPRHEPGADAGPFTVEFDPLDIEDDDFILVGSFSDPALAATAREVLEQAGIPCEIEVQETEPPESRTEHNVMVPSSLTLEATSILDKEVFNPGIEEDWKTHMDDLSDKQLLALNIDLVCAGLRDRIERLRATYFSELQRRGLDAK